MGLTQGKFEVPYKDCDSVKYPNKLLISECNSDSKRFQFLKRFFVIQEVNFNALPRLQPILTDTQPRSNSRKLEKRAVSNDCAAVN